MGGVRLSARAPLFIDSSGWIAVNDHGDTLFAAASLFYREHVLANRRKLLTTNLVIAETHAGLLKARDKRVAGRFLALVSQSARLDVIYSTPELEDEARGIISKLQDQPFSYCDAVSFAVMKKFGIKNAFAFDRHFETAGFRRLP